MKKVQGFSLAEIAIVLVVLGFLLGNLLNPITKKIERDRLKLTQQRLEEIKEALLGYAVIRGCLPCPIANEDDVERRIEKTIEGEKQKTICNACSNFIKEGFLPWKDLGIGGYDAWGNVFRYRVKEDYTNNNLTSNTKGNINIKSLYKDELGEENYLTTKDGDYVVALIFSYGPDGQAHKDNEDHNLSYTYEGSTTDQFNDDIITWISKNTVNNYLVTSGQIRYPEVEGWRWSKDTLRLYLCDTQPTLPECQSKD